MTTVAPRPPEQDELQALIEEARVRARHRRQRYVAVLLLALAAGAGLYMLLSSVADRPVASGRHSRVTSLGPERFRPGQFWYTRTISWDHASVPAGGIVQRHARYHPVGPKVRFEFRVNEETWVGLDGTLRDRAVVSDVHFASPLDHQRWTAYGRPIPNFNHHWLGWIAHDGITEGGSAFPPILWGSWWGEWANPSGWDVGDSLFSYRQLLALSARPAVLRARIAAAIHALTRRTSLLVGRTAGTAFGTGNDMTDLSPLGGSLAELGDIGTLLMSPLPASARLALFHAALTLPFVIVNRDAHDALGRHAVAVSVSRGHGRIVPIAELLFDPGTGALLGEAPHVAIVAHGVVDSPYTLPTGVKAIRPPGAPPAPWKLSITPAAGRPRTRFRVTVSPPAQTAPHGPPVLGWALIGTPAIRCFGGLNPRPAPLMAASSSHTGGRPEYVYNLTPPGSSWCPRRYELNVIPEYPRQHELLEALGGSPDRITGVGSSTYFRVK